MTKEKAISIKLESVDRYLLTVMVENDSYLPEVEKIIESSNITLEKSENLGEKTLAYPIKKHNALTMLSFFIKATDSESIKALDKTLYRDSKIVRYLLTNWQAEIPVPREDRRGRR